MRSKLQPYPPTITFLGELDALEWWKRKSSDTQPSRNEGVKWLPQELLYLQMSLRISPVLSGFSPLTNTQRVSSFELRYQLVVRYGAQSCEMALWSSRLPSMEIPLPLLEILVWDLEFHSNFTWELLFQRKQLLKLANKCSILFSVGDIMSPKYIGISCFIHHFWYLLNCPTRLLS